MSNKKKTQKAQLKAKKNKRFVPWLSLLFSSVLIIYWSWMVLNGGSASEASLNQLIDFGGMSRPAVIAGESWRLLSNVLLHKSFFHLALNVLALSCAAYLIEKHIGAGVLLFLITSATLLGSFVSLLIYKYSVVVGASGISVALATMLGIGLFRSLISYSANKAIVLVSLGAVAINLLLSINDPSVNHNAHLSGLAVGLVSGLLWGASQFRQKALQWFHIIMIALVVLGTFVMIPRLDNPIGEYQSAFKHFSDMETEAMKCFELDSNATQEAMVECFEPAIQNWLSAYKAFDEVKLYTMPPILQNRIQNLKLYCSYRKEQFELVGLYFRTLDDGFFDAAQLTAEKIDKLLPLIQDNAQEAGRREKGHATYSSIDLSNNTK